MPLVFSFKAPDRDEFACALQCRTCGAQTASGQPCRKRACIGTPLCWMHMLKTMNLRYKASTIPGAGKGLFAMRPGADTRTVVFRAGQRIVPYHGERLRMADLDLRYGDYTAPYGVTVDRRADVYEDGACIRGVGALANHATGRRVNAKFREQDGVSALFATKAIRHGDEILVDYGAMYRFTEGTRFRTTRRRR